MSVKNRMTNAYKRKLLTVLCAAEAEGMLDEPHKRRYWIHPIHKQKQEEGSFDKFYEEIRRDEEKFVDYYRMSLKSFDELLELIRPQITMKETFSRIPISAEQRLTITLRYLATSTSFRCLQSEFFIAISTITGIVKTTCQAIWNRLKHKEMPAPTVQQWIDIAGKFYENTGVPNCVGAIEAKYIMNTHLSSPNTNAFANTKKRTSVVLTAIVDAYRKFITVDVSRGDDCVEFKNTPIGKLVYNEQMKLPPPQCLPHTDSKPQEFVLVGGEAFRVHKNLLRPFSQRVLDERQKMFNDRLSRCRRAVDDVTNAMSEKWRILLSPIMVNLDFQVIIVRTCCVLYNFVQKREGNQSDEGTKSNIFFPNVRNVGGSGGSQKKGTETRNYFADYFMRQHAEASQH